MSTPLETYMKKAGIGDADFAARVGRDRSMISKVRRGRTRPTLDLAALIETETGGAVPMQAWAQSAVAA